MALLIAASLIYTLHASGHMAYQIRNKRNVAYEAGDHLTALEHHLQAVAINPQDASYRSDLARTHHAPAQYDKAISEYTRALDLEQGLPQALCGRADTYQAIGATAPSERDHIQA